MNKDECKHLSCDSERRHGYFVQVEAEDREYLDGSHDMFSNR